MKMNVDRDDRGDDDCGKTDYLESDSDLVFLSEVKQDMISFPTVYTVRGEDALCNWTQ